jgi:hypothetical protein
VLAIGMAASASLVLLVDDPREATAVSVPEVERISPSS